MIDDDYRLNEHHSIDRLARSRGHLERVFGSTLAATITSDRISAYARARKDEGAANATINRELEALKRAFHLAAIAGRVARVPHVAMLKENNVRKGFLEPHEFKAMAALLSDDVRPLAETLYVTAWRPGGFALGNGNTWTQRAASCGWSPARQKTMRARCSP